MFEAIANNVPSFGMLVGVIGAMGLLRALVAPGRVCEFVHGRLETGTGDGVDQ
jgi:flagellar motor component MotA